MTSFEAFALGLGPLGIFIGMALESSIIPIPSEAILVTAGLLGYSPVTVAIWGGLGSTFGSIFGYGIGKYGGRPLIRKFGKYVFVKEDNLTVLEGWFKRWGGLVVLIGRLIPFIPYKIFSIASGIAKMDFKGFMIFTFIGSIPRAFLFSYFGKELLKIKSPVVIIVALVITTLIPIAIERMMKKQSKHLNKEKK